MPGLCRWSKVQDGRIEADTRPAPEMSGETRRWNSDKPRLRSLALAERGFNCETGGTFTVLDLGCTTSPTQFVGEVASASRG